MANSYRDLQTLYWCGSSNPYALPYATNFILSLYRCTCLSLHDWSDWWDNIDVLHMRPLGTKKLSEVVVVALQERLACLMANHGMLAVGPNLSSALETAILVEELSKQYLLSKTIGDPVLISKQEMSVVVGKFQTYGSQNV